MSVTQTIQSLPGSQLNHTCQHHQKKLDNYDTAIIENFSEYISEHLSRQFPDEIKLGVQRTVQQFFKQQLELIDLHCNTTLSAARHYFSGSYIVAHCNGAVVENVQSRSNLHPIICCWGKEHIEGIGLLELVKRDLHKLEKVVGVCDEDY